MFRLGWQSIDQRRDYFTANLMYKCINSTAPTHLQNSMCLVSENHAVQTRSAQNKDVVTPRPNIELFKKSLSYNGPLVWNALPTNLKSSENISDFKRSYKEHFF